MTRDQRAYLGIGWKFPLQVTALGGIAQSSAEQRIEEAIYLILGTAKGERLMLPNFGCRVHDLVFAPNNAAVMTQVVQTVRAALTENEPRIDVLELDAQSAPGQPNLLLIRINYRIRSNNAVHNLTYPFFITEGA
jgi:phage baseplate assembly protein W